MLKNKHIIAAMIIAPLLAIMSYFLTDNMVSEKPHAAEPGKAYPLVAKSNCRYESGSCTLENGELKLQLSVLSGEYLHLESSIPLEQVTVAILGIDREGNPQTMQLADESGTRWRIPVQRSDFANSNLRLALLTRNKSYFFAETLMIFARHETAIPQQQWSSTSHPD
jgi:hypothetical protein